MCVSPSLCLESLRLGGGDCQVVNQHGSDALRLYLIDSPVVRAESMRFREEGVFAVVKEVFLPWYNAYRFLVQNANRYSSNTGQVFAPSLDAAKSSDNVLDKWMLSVVSSLSTFVKVEMEAYRLYTVVPRLIKFIDMLTNVYVRFNRRRMRGRAPFSFIFLVPFLFQSRSCQWCRAEPCRECGRRKGHVSGSLCALLYADDSVQDHGSLYPVFHGDAVPKLEKGG